MLILILFVLFLVGVMLGFPVVFSIGISALFGLIQSNHALVAMPLRMFTGINNYPLLAIPFFILVGNIMNTCGITQRFIILANTIIGSVRSSLAQVNILASVFLAGISGSDIADSASIGSILIPSMKENGYTAEEAAVITGTSSTIGPIFPPSVTMILYGSLTGTSILGMFLAGVIPGLLIGLALMIVTYILSLKRPNSMGNSEVNRSTFSLKKVWQALKENVFTLPIPIIIVGGIYGGIFTVTEAGTVAALYSFIIGFFVYRALDYAKIKKILLETAMTTSLVGIIISVSYLFSYLLSVHGFASQIVSLIAPLSDHSLLMLFALTLIFFLLGCFVPITVILVIFAQFLPTIGNLVGIPTLQFAMIILLSLELGVITPPYGTILYIVSYIADTSVIKCIPTLIPYLIAMIIVIILVMFIPSLTLFVPTILGL